MQYYCQLAGDPEPIRARCLGTSAVVVESAPSEIEVRWQDGHTDAIDPGTIAGPGSADGTADDWLVVAQYGQSTLTLIAYSDYPIIDSLTGGTKWAVLARVCCDRIVDWQQ